jgi:hypothetical protein
MKRKMIWMRALHKSASMFLHNYSKSIVSRLGDGWEHFSQNNSPPNAESAKSAVGSGILCWRGFGPTPDWAIERNDSIILCQLRDPRDILVSEYFSIGFLHSENFLHEDARSTKQMIADGKLSIDEFVQRSAVEGISFSKSSLKRRYQQLLVLEQSSKELGFPIKMVKYEDMVLHYRQWCSDVLQFLELSDFGNDLFEEFKSEFDVAGLIERGEQMTHRRAVLPGDYKGKLSDESIRFIEQEFDFIIDRFYT